MAELKGKQKAQEKHEAELLAEAEELKQSLKRKKQLLELKRKQEKMVDCLVLFHQNKLLML